ncbi:uncharacterized protein LOC123308179 [Coccinella septempunctata]|uniref:uncharacterized protein LOC123308179 n=1 Tax=Coccinella septempunctata TaxID=41139 RepID=UPI001D08D3BD|nr:uncharacterized protein LOC123308179 [Coccinella septempunctata]
MFLKWSILLIGLICVQKISGHGMMLEPPNRSSLWRFPQDFPGAIPNYNDNENFCGGMNVQWNTFGGKCGVCGDRYDKPHPQDNENTGKYGKMGIARTYKSGEIIDVQIRLTTNHLGYFQYSICVLENPSAPESGEDCFKPVTLEDGSEHYNVSSVEKTINNRVKLPDGLTCDRCVFRWHYNAGNNWGKCDDGTSKEGCGPQETFRSCADIRIEA